MRRASEESSLLSGFTLPPQVLVTSLLDEALAGTKAVIMAVPFQTMRQNIALVAEHFEKSMLIVSAAKGLEIGSNQRMSQIIAEEIEPRFRSNICVLSGPNLSQEILSDLPAATVVAADDEAIARKAQIPHFHTAKATTGYMLSSLSQHTGRNIDTHGYSPTLLQVIGVLAVTTADIQNPGTRYAGHQQEFI